jgi:cytochrome c5
MKAKIITSALVLGAVVAASGFLSAAQTDSQDKKGATKQDKTSGSKTGVNDGQGNGERVFAEHCSRCHNAPQGFSPRIAGTITRHMRVRANLSQEEERALLRFFNP